jgi:hypothetical protein
MDLPPSAVARNNSTHPVNQPEMISSATVSPSIYNQKPAPATPPDSLLAHVVSSDRGRNATPKIPFSVVRHKYPYFPRPRNPTPDACYLPFCLLQFSLDTPAHSW